MLDLNFDGFFTFMYRIIIISIASIFERFLYFLTIKLLLYTLLDHYFNVNGGKVQKLHSSLILFFSEFSFAETDDVRESKGKEGAIFFHLLSFAQTHKHSDPSWHFYILDDYLLFFNCSTCNCYTLTQGHYHTCGK